MPVIGRTEKSFLNFKQRDFYNVLTRPHLTREIVTIEPLYFISELYLLYNSLSLYGPSFRLLKRRAAAAAVRHIKKLLN